MFGLIRTTSDEEFALAEDTLRDAYQKACPPGTDLLSETKILLTMGFDRIDAAESCGEGTATLARLHDIVKTCTDKEIQRLYMSGESDSLFRMGAFSRPEFVERVRADFDAGTPHALSVACRWLTETSHFGFVKMNKKDPIWGNDVSIDDVLRFFKRCVRVGVKGCVDNYANLLARVFYWDTEDSKRIKQVVEEILSLWEHKETRHSVALLNNVLDATYANIDPKLQSESRKRALIHDARLGGTLFGLRIAKVLPQHKVPRNGLITDNMLFKNGESVKNMTGEKIQRRKMYELPAYADTYDFVWDLFHRGWMNYPDVRTARYPRLEALRARTPSYDELLKDPSSDLVFCKVCSLSFPVVVDLAKKGSRHATRALAEKYTESKFVRSRSGKKVLARQNVATKPWLDENKDSVLWKDFLSLHALVRDDVFVDLFERARRRAAFVALLHPRCGQGAFGVNSALFDPQVLRLVLSLALPLPRFLRPCY